MTSMGDLQTSSSSSKLPFYSSTEKKMKLLGISRSRPLTTRSKVKVCSRVTSTSSLQYRRRSSRSSKLTNTSPLSFANIKDSYSCTSISTTESIYDSDDRLTFLSKQRLPRHRSVEHSTKSSVSKQYKQLSKAVQRLNSLLLDIQNNNSSSCMKSKYPKKERLDIPDVHERDCLVKLANATNFLSEQVEKEVLTLISNTKHDKNRLDALGNDNFVLTERLSNALNMQKHLEGELSEITKENKLLETENKNLAIKIVPYISDRSPMQRLNSPQPKNDNRRNNHNVEIFFQNRKTNSSDIFNNNSVCEYRSDNEVIRPVTKNCYTSCTGTAGTSSGFPTDCSHPRKVEVETSMHNDDVPKALREAGESNRTVQELDSIRSYVWRKGTDVDRLHGKLNKNLEEMHKLRETVGCIAHEKENILADLEDLVESYREVEKERDNYASILKMILREKNSSESNLYKLLDGLLEHMNNSTASSAQSNNDQAASKCGNGGFLESALYVIQEQNISIREEMARVRESLQKTTGQNMLLHEHNDELTAKVQKMQQELDAKGQEDELKESVTKGKYEELDKLYNTVLAAKDGLDKCLQEKEEEIRKLKDLLKVSEKASSRQAKKNLALQKANMKLVKEAEHLNHAIAHLKSNLKDQKGKWHERIKTALNDLEQSKDHCKWLETQIDNLNAQLVEAHERVKAHQTDKLILAQKVLSAEEERKILDRKIFEIKSVMQGDTVFRTALAERNEILQSEINRLRQEGLSESRNTAELEKCIKYDGERGESSGDQPHAIDDLTVNPIDNSIPPAVQYTRDVPPRKNRHAVPRNKHHSHNNAPRAAVSLHDPAALCSRGRSK